MIYKLLQKFIKNLILFSLRSYKYLLSPFLGTNCRFFPTCSDYAQEAILKKGIIKGCYLAIKRLSKCQPWGKSGYDPLVK